MKKVIFQLLFASVGFLGCSSSPALDKDLGNDNIEKPSDKEKNDKIIGNGLKKTGDTQNPQFWMRVIIGILLFIAVFESIDRLRERKNRKS